ncbi:MAG: hypothetical protein SV375_11525 [Thermodesulfobacteriota bacterium]|nr:hypothetical protein [Thermodesulfobacteriota bacterium]
MRETLKIRFIIFTLLFIFTVFGCLPGNRRGIVGHGEEKSIPFILPADVINKKISYLKMIIDSQRLDDEDREIAHNLLFAYKDIRSYTQGRVSNVNYQKIINILFSHLSILDEKYFSKKKIDDQQYPEVMALFSRKRKKILNSYLAGDYRGVIDDCIELEAVFGPDSLTPEISILFAFSLSKKKMLKEAVNISEKIVRELEGRIDLIQLRANIIQWQLDLGHREKAIKAYDKLTDNFDEMNSIFRLAKQKITGRGIGEDKGITPDDHSIVEKGIHEHENINRLLSEVDRLIQRHSFDKAKLLLIRHRLKTQEGPDMETIDQALKTVELAEKSFRGEKNEDISPKKTTIKLAMKLIEEEKFEEALTRLEELEDNQDMSHETADLKDLAIEKIINRERTKAAKIFLMAKKESDPLKKKHLFTSSYNILKALIDRYPSSNLINKLNSHLKRVKGELNKLDAVPES